MEVYGGLAEIETGPGFPDPGGIEGLDAEAGDPGPGPEPWF